MHLCGARAMYANFADSASDQEEELSVLRAALKKGRGDDRDADLIPEDSAAANGLSPEEMRSRIEDLEKQVMGLGNPAGAHRNWGRGTRVSCEK